MPRRTSDSAVSHINIYFKLKVFVPQNYFSLQKRTYDIQCHQSVTKIVEKDLYCLRNLFAEIGGFVGIFFGSSLFDLVNLLMSGLQHRVDKNKKKFSKKKKIQK